MILDRLHPVLVAILGIGILSVMDALLKHVGVHYPTFQLVFLRFLFGSMAALAFWLGLRPPRPSREAIRTNLLRGCVGSLTATTFFYSLQTLPLAEAIAFSFLSPLFLALFGGLILGEIVGRNTMIGLAIGFLGMVVMVLSKGIGTTGFHLFGAMAAIASALFYALSLTLLRQRARQDALITIVAFQNAVPALILALPAAFVWVAPRPADLLVFALIALLGVGGHYTMGMAYRREEANKLAVAEYSALLYAASLGFVFFGELPGWSTLAGTLLIVAGTALAMRRRGGTPESPVEPAP